jgi:predicted HAD superfamily phosphohydrolase YqeG
MYSHENEMREQIHLGPQLVHNRGKICLVLDLDETLVSANYTPNKKYPVSFSFNLEDSINKRTTNFFVIKRPGETSVFELNLALEIFFLNFFL